MPVRCLLGAVEVHLRELGEGRCVGELELLPSGKAHDAIELNLILGELVVRCDGGLLALLVLHLSAQFIEACADAGFASLARLVEERLRGVLLGLGIGQVGLVGEHLQVG